MCFQEHGPSIGWSYGVSIPRQVDYGRRKEGRNEARDHPCLESSLRGTAGSAYEEREGAGGVADAWTGRDGMV